ncbi:unnamed protein product [Fraxinus pennsylvanica]|uniref:CW-type domain-containing protein n=1 Tax=Fraxinus pennsylvanica TaxID=56036 RepID=A0AAD2E708_9LAMI|nr:unnamed protein product [Fraxinus pennsylvanica]
MISGSSSMETESKIVEREWLQVKSNGKNEKMPLILVEFSGFVGEKCGVFVCLLRFGEQTVVQAYVEVHEAETWIDMSLVGYAVDARTADSDSPSPMYSEFRHSGSEERRKSTDRERRENSDSSTMEIKAEKTPMKRSKAARTVVPRNSIDVWSVQCEDCLKWRIIPNQEEYEEIRRKIVEDPFVCSKKSNVSCDDPADMEYDNSCVWVIDKPNLPKTPPGFQRELVLRKDFSKLDCYYFSPNGRKLRAGTEVALLLKENPEYKDLSTSDFSFTVPKVMTDTVPVDAAKVESSCSSKRKLSSV